MASGTKTAGLKVLQADKAGLIEKAREISVPRDNSPLYEFVDSVQVEGTFVATKDTFIVGEGKENAGTEVEGYRMEIQGEKIAPVHWVTEITGKTTRLRMGTLQKLLAKSGQKTKFYLVLEKHKTTQKERFQLAI